MRQGDKQHLAFEKLGKEMGLDMSMHPMFLLYLNSETDKFLEVFKAGWEAKDMSEAKRLNESDLSELLSGKDEFELMDLLATEVGVAGSESQEERNSSAVFRRSVLRSAIKQLRAR